MIVCKNGNGLKPRKFLDVWVGGTFMGLNSYKFEPEENDGFENIENGDFVHALAKNRTSNVVLAILTDKNGNTKEILRSDDLVSLNAKNTIDSFLSLFNNSSNVPTHIFKGGVKVC